MNLSTSLRGRLRNTNLPLTNALFPLFEAVVNSIHSIDSAINQGRLTSLNEGNITIKILRSSQTIAFSETKPEITGFEIIDNGIGFTTENYKSFQTLDSEFKIELGCRGVGRLLWLKAFNKVSIKSTYIQSQKITTRTFEFNVTNDIHGEYESITPNAKIETSIKLLNIKKEYLKYLKKTASTISHNLLEHCLWYFIRGGGAPDISIIDQEEEISLNSKYEELMINASERTSFTLKSKVFEITHVKLKASLQNRHSIIYSAAERVVKEDSLQGKIPGLYGLLNNGEEKFIYMCFLTSDYLTDNVTPERVGFNISETIDGFFADEEISFGEIRDCAMGIITNYLDQYLIESKENGKKRLTDFIDNKAPRYRPILGRLNEEDLIVDPNISDKDLEIKLHSHLMELESQLLSEGHDLMVSNQIEDKDDYSKRIDEYLLKASDLKRSDLANYVAHRKVILDLLRKSIIKRENGKYYNEDVIHKLIMPMQTVSNEIKFEDSNLWLVDERLAFHNFLASDKALTSIPITNSDSAKEPDLVGLSVYDTALLVNDRDTLPLASITVVEIKRPMRNDAKAGEDKDPIEQALGYLKRVRNGVVKTNSGRLIPNSEHIPGFCYIICDITPSIIERCELFDLNITADKLGYFGYNSSRNAYIEVISFDRLVNMATERNKAFFDKLGFPSN